MCSKKMEVKYTLAESVAWFAGKPFIDDCPIEARPCIEFSIAMFVQGKVLGQVCVVSCFPDHSTRKKCAKPQEGPPQRTGLTVVFHLV